MSLITPGTQACKALREEGYKVILVNSNPATIMTDPEMADRTYIEPITVEIIDQILAIEKHRMPCSQRIRARPALTSAWHSRETGVLKQHGCILSYAAVLMLFGRPKTEIFSSGAWRKSVWKAHEAI